MKIVLCIYLFIYWTEPRLFFMLCKKDEKPGVRFDLTDKDRLTVWNKKKVIILIFFQWNYTFIHISEILDTLGLYRGFW